MKIKEEQAFHVQFFSEYVMNPNHRDRCAEILLLSFICYFNEFYKNNPRDFFFFLGDWPYIVSQKVNQERGLGEQISAQVLMLLDEGGGGGEVEKNALVGLSLSDLLRIRTGSPLRVFPC